LFPFIVFQQKTPSLKMGRCETPILSGRSMSVGISQHVCYHFLVQIALWKLKRWGWLQKNVATVKSSTFYRPMLTEVAKIKLK